MPRSAALLLLALCAAPTPGSAQDLDALVLPRGAVGVRVGGSFTSYDGARGGVSLGAPFAASFRRSSYPELDSLYNALGTFLQRTSSAGGAFTLDERDVDPGTLDVGVSADVRRAPIGIEVGVLKRLTVGVTVPIERYGTELTRLGLSGGTIGPNARPDSLRTLLTRIDPSLAVLARRAFVPLRGSEAGVVLQDRYTRITGDTTSLPLPSRLGNLDELPRLVGEDAAAALALDARRSGYVLGDVEVSARFQLLNQVGDGVMARDGVRVAVEGGARLPTGRATAVDSLLHLTTLVGHAGASAGVLGDVVRGRWMLTAAARHAVVQGRRVAGVALTAPFPADLAAREVERDPGDRTTLTVAPRFRLTPEMMLGGRYSFARIGETTYGAGGPLAGLGLTGARSGHLLGLGAWYSMRDAWLAGRAVLPLELAISFERAVAGGAEDVRRVEITGRVFERVWARPQRVRAAAPPAPTQPPAPTRPATASPAGGSPP